MWTALPNWNLHSQTEQEILLVVYSRCNDWCDIYRGYCMPARGYEFCLRVLNSLSHEWAPRYEFCLRVLNSLSHEWATRTSENGHVIFCLLYKHPNSDGVDDFPKISNARRTLPNARRTLPNIFRRFPNITKDIRGGTDRVSIIQQHIWVLFKRLCSYSNGNLETCVILRVKICLRAKAHLVFHRCLYDNKCISHSSIDPLIAYPPQTRRLTGIFFNKK